MVAATRFDEPSSSGTGLTGLYRLQCKAQTYAWGLQAHSSEVASLCKAGGQTIDPAAPYAELWMGTHPSGPSTLNSLTGPALSALLSSHPEFLGTAASAFPEASADGCLPFLFKVLSIGGALSIQSHPDKALAERLHASQPQHYKDDNHKPEMVVALTPCEALCGFAPRDEVAKALKEVPELREVCGESACEAYEHAGDDAAAAKALQELFRELMLADEERVGLAVDSLAARVNAIPESKCSKREELVSSLAAQYPRDVGVLAALVLNHMELAPGEALALEANVPHAYLAGQALEAMAASDNVIRAGLTPKFRDACTLCESLRYEQRVPAVLTGEKVNTENGPGSATLQRYRPPFPEFEVYLGTGEPGTALKLDAASGPALLLVLRGSASAGRVTEICRGQVFFLAAGQSLSLQALGEETFQVAAVTVNGMGFGSYREVKAA